jgi:hypothetical protein
MLHFGPALARAPYAGYFSDEFVNTGLILASVKKSEKK